jgi:prepilin-type N-terminal cleavage/methylation domain-containing protein
MSSHACGGWFGRVARGYTLVELLIVVAVLGIAGAMVIPQMNSTDVLRIQAAVRTIVADINFAQSDALARQQARAVVFDVPNNSYALLEVPGSVLNPTTDTIYEVNFNNRVKFHNARIVSASFDGNANLLFDEMGGPINAPGSSTPSAGGRVVVEGSGSTFEILVEAYTGRVVVNRLGP